MTIQQALFNYLSTFPGLTGLIGTRVYPLRPPQNATKPYVTYAKVTGPRVRTFSTDQGGQPRFDFTCTADDYSSADAVRAQVRVALEGYSGLMGGAVNVVSVQQNNEVDLQDPEAKLYHLVVDFTISYQGA